MRPPGLGFDLRDLRLYHRARDLSMNYAADFKSIQDDVSPQEWQTRLDLAACYRLVDSYGMTDLIYNHITARIPGSPDHLLINLYGLLYKEITASSLVKIDVEGNIMWQPDTDYGINMSGYVIHGAIHTMYQLEMSCRSQVDAMAARTELTMPGENVLAHTAHLYQPGTRRPYGVLEWPAMLRLLEAGQKSSGYPPYWN